MNFFEHQHRARRKTGLLVLYFLVAVVLTVLVLNLAIYLALTFSEPEIAPTLDEWLDSGYWLWVTLAVVAVVTFGSLRSYMKLAGGGRAVAEMVGARRIKMSSTDPDERRFINVVEEMAIASGTPVPALYVMDEERGINAFVAGYRVNQAVMVVTRGALEQLNRDELQGVVGHEFSHVLNGDMRLNVRLIATLAGILAIGQVGGFLLRSLRFSGRSRSGGKSGNNIAIVLVIALILFVVGYIGLFFGRLIKAAVSRQREYLADASAVQFTRNPEGIAGALWKIGQSTSRLDNAHAEDTSHMCFSSALKLSTLLATHPPIAKRIQAIDPHSQAKQTARRAAQTSAQAPASAGDVPDGSMGFTGSGERGVETTPQQVVASVGNPTERHYQFAETLHSALPAPLLEAAHDENRCRNVVYALVLLDTDAATFEVTATMVRTQEGEEAEREARRLVSLLKPLGSEVRLAVIDIVLPALETLDETRRENFLGTVKALVQSDRRYTLFEFVLLAILNEHLKRDAGEADVIKYNKADEVINEIRILLSLLALSGRTPEADGQEAFQRVMRYFTGVRFEMAGREELKPERLHEMFDKLRQLSPLVKKSVITACADLVLHDGRILPREAELLRATSLSLDCPMPPMLPTV